MDHRPEARLSESIWQGRNCEAIPTGEGGNTKYSEIWASLLGNFGTDEYQARVRGGQNPYVYRSSMTPD